MWLGGMDGYLNEWIGDGWMGAWIETRADINDNLVLSKNYRPFPFLFLNTPTGYNFHFTEALILKERSKLMSSKSSS